MNKFIDELSNKMYELYKVYESYALNETNKRIVIILENPSCKLKMILKNNVAMKIFPKKESPT